MKNFNLKFSKVDIVTLVAIILLGLSVVGSTAVCNTIWAPCCWQPNDICVPVTGGSAKTTYDNTFGRDCSLGMPFWACNSYMKDNTGTVTYYSEGGCNSKDKIKSESLKAPFNQIQWAENTAYGCE